MKEYIEREVVCNDCANQKICVDKSRCPVGRASAADVVERKRGEWVDKPSGRYGQWQSWCSACGRHSGIGGIEKNRHKPFCPNCGADMREVDHDQS